MKWFKELIQAVNYKYSDSLIWFSIHTVIIARENLNIQIKNKFLKYNS